MAFIEPLSLTGRHVALEPLSLEHEEALAEAVCDGELWKLWFTFIATPEKMHDYIQTAMQMREQGAMPFVVRDLRTGKIVGTTRFFNVDATHRRVEIGYTWYAASVQRSAINSECKKLLLTHAFESLQCIAVEFRTSWMNHRSRAAIARLGAKQDGVLRSHQLHADGSLRDTVVFSITTAEWPTVKKHLQFKLGE